MNSSLADYLQIWGFEQDLIIYADGSLGFALDCVPVDISTWSDEDINNYSEGIKQFLNGLPENIDIQFVQDIVPGNNVVLDKYKKLSQKTENETARFLCFERVSALEEDDSLGQIPIHRLKILVRRPLSQNLIAKPSLFSKEKLFQDISEMKLSRDMELILRLRENLTQSLEALHLKVNNITADEMAGLLYSQWNPSRRIPLKNYNPDEVRQSLLYSDVGISVHGFVVGTTQFRVLSLKTLPDQTFS